MFNSSKPVLILANFRGWAWDIKAQNLKRVLELRKIPVDIKYYYDYVMDKKTGWHDVGYSPGKKISFDHYSAVIMFSISMIEIINETFCYENAYVGICSHESYNGRPDNPNSVKMLNRFKGVFVLNKILYSEFIDVIDRLYYCPNGVNTSYFMPMSSVGARELIHVGWVGDPEHSCQKGFYEVVEPIKNIAGYKLIIANKKERYIDHENMVNFYNDIDVLVCASAYEGTPNPCLEAASCERPILTTAVGNMPDFIKHGYNGFFIKRDPMSLQKKLSVLQKRRYLLNRLGENARISALEWDWDLQAENFLTMLENKNMK